MSRIRTVMGVALVTAGLLFVLLYLGPRWALPESRRDPTPTSSRTSSVPSLVPEADSETTDVAARVYGYTITQSYLSEMVRLNRVLEALSGAPALGERETLERLVAWHLIVKSAPPGVEPADEEVQGYVASLQRNWGLSEEALAKSLEEGGVDRAFLEQTIRRLLTVSAAVEILERDGYTLSEWLNEQERDADVWIRPDLATAAEAEVEEAAASWPRIETPVSLPQVPEVAPAFTLERAGGGTFSLEDGLTEGPVVLVFFERCA